MLDSTLITTPSRKFKLHQTIKWTGIGSSNFINKRTQYALVSMCVCVRARLRACGHACVGTRVPVRAYMDNPYQSNKAALRVFIFSTLLLVSVVLASWYTRRVPRVGAIDEVFLQSNMCTKHEESQCWSITSSRFNVTIQLWYTYASVFGDGQNKMSTMPRVDNLSRADWFLHATWSSGLRFRDNTKYFIKHVHGALAYIVTYRAYIESYINVLRSHDKHHT